MQPQDKMIRLESDVFTVGRSNNNTYVITENFRNCKAVSKVHFIIRKEAAPGGATRVTLQDKSTNGTFVNKKRVGKEKSVDLLHDDVIGIEGERAKNFVYMSTNKEYLRRFPEALRSKYVMSKELGRGACGVVYLGIRKADHACVAVKEINKQKVCKVW